MRRPRALARSASARASSISARMRWMADAEADEDRLADQEVADVELDDLGDARRSAPTVSKVEAVAGVDLEAGRAGRCAAPRRSRSSSRASPAASSSSARSQ